MTDLLPGYLPGFLAAYAILVVAASSPGPAVAMLLGIGLQSGRPAALTASAGIATGSVVLNLGTIIGVGLLLGQIAWAMTLLRVIGAAYLAWLAWGAFRKAADPGAVTAATVPGRSALQFFLLGFLLQVTNVKAIVFWIAIASVGATAGGGPVIIAAFVAGAWAISFGIHGAWALLLSSTPFRAAYARARRGIEATLGAFFCLASFKLLTSRG